MMPSISIHYGLLKQPPVPSVPRLQASPAVVHAMAWHHLDLLLVALLYGCAFTGALFVATSLVLLAFLACALLVTIALAVCDVLRFAGPAARVAHEAAANLRLAHALAVHAVLKAAVVSVLVLRSGPRAARSRRA
ncbi:hypothetical protein PR202_ga05937 [Eleusine coracana subsp. coracana]|uniref:Uncharacterized protein n=1 Tax=Eleusine coracana subsp. coracana TaxID=191504 RepID=A0AAV5BVZ6_ELECO|nr:hypothetical protein PR202_ga05937 [Eleusine coracana subsp. coracana]